MLDFLDERTAVAPGPVQLSFQLEMEASDELRKISFETGVPPETLLRVALRFLFIAADARAKNRRILVTSSSGRPLNELIIPEGQP